jgi:hypothetical protein
MALVWSFTWGQPSAGTQYWTRLVMFVTGLVALPLGVILFRQASLGYIKAEREFFARHPELKDDLRVTLLQRLWRQTSPDDAAGARDTLGSQVPRDRATIVACGYDAAPAIAAHHFEPVIITATEMSWTDLKWLPLALLFVGWVVADFTGLLPASLPVWFPSLESWVGLPLIALLGWIWFSTVRPRYVRLAPGVIQFMVYTFWGGKPQIRSYPMTGGTVALLVHDKRGDILSLARGKDEDRIQFSKLRAGPERLEQTWRALLSTAPTPPLSDTDLLG